MGAARERGVRTAAWTSAAAVLLLCWMAFFGAGVARAGSPCVGCSGSYSGDWSATYELKNPGEESHKVLAISLKWAASLTFQGGENVWTLTSASGTFSIKNSPKGEEDCTATLSPGPDAVVHGEAFWVSTNLGKGLISEAESQYVTMVAEPPASWGQSSGLNPLQSSSSAGGCGSQSVMRLGGPWHRTLGGANCHWEDSSGHSWIAFPVGQSHTEADVCTATGGEGENFWKGVSLNAQMSLNVPGKGAGGAPVGGTNSPLYGPFFSAAKEDARDDLRNHAIPNAEHFCLGYVGGLLTGGAGVLTLGIAGSGGGALAVAGSLTAAALAPFCNATLERIAKDMKAYRDPPLASIHVLARPHAARAAALPSCGRFHRRAKRLCTELRGAYARLDAAAAKVAADAGAIEETVSRETASVIAGNSSAAAAQDAHLGTLLRTVKTDRASEGSAGKAVATALKSAHVEFRISRAQSSNVIAAVVRHLAKRGVAKRALERVESSPLKPKAADLRGALARL